jgi:hypothetical protein
MPSLGAHLREPDSHDRLPFHPSCPICRQTRLSGRLPSDGLVSPRTQALLAAGVLAISAAAPGAVAVAAEQDQQQDGTASVGQSGPAGPADGSDFDPGGGGTDLPQAASAVPQTQAPADPGNDDTGPVDQTATTNLDDPVVDSGDGLDAAATAPSTATQQTRAPVDSSTAPTTVTTLPSASADSTPAPSATPEVATPDVSLSPAATPRVVHGASHSSRRAHQPAKAPQGGSSRVSPAPAAPVTAPATAPAASATATVPVAVSGHHATPGDRTHTVLPGESLWTIATDVLGADASTARVAREVHRLWQLNRDRIGTGDPDLLRIGTRLELR